MKGGKVRKVQKHTRQGCGDRPQMMADGVKAGIVSPLNLWHQQYGVSFSPRRRDRLAGVLLLSVSPTGRSGPTRREPSPSQPRLQVAKLMIAAEAVVTHELTVALAYAHTRRVQSYIAYR
ncbi:hypothetical protein CesoFtcFv8_013102 [Champsocephalus esox]|uniref:Uncharacterized protein n=1 Tax=Champsocephalus esox TaxID=159716 RepID=A0AAN8BWK5_9TELE|nr:hypothetical protein CesoFtcFv8_013102 [Champsocephalus esox]